MLDNHNSTKIRTIVTISQAVHTVIIIHSLHLIPTDCSQYHTAKRCVFQYNITTSNLSLYSLLYHSPLSQIILKDTNDEK